jgi:putative ATPase
VESPKSNAIAVTIGRIMESIESIKSAEVPLHLRDGHYSGAKKLGHVGYQYPHDYPGHYVEQNYLPDKLSSKVFYEATEQGMEDKIRQNQLNRSKKHMK